MIKKYGWIIAGLVVALLAVGVFGITTAFADDNGPTRPFGNRGKGLGSGGRGLDGVALEAVADVLNMSTDDLSAALEEGRTLPELAEDSGVDMQAVFDALSAVREQAMREHIAQAVEDGTMSQDQADWMLEGLDKGYFFNHGGFGKHMDKWNPSTPSE